MQLIREKETEGLVFDLYYLDLYGTQITPVLLIFHMLALMLVPVLYIALVAPCVVLSGVDD